jgi:hypothetical protein
MDTTTNHEPFSHPFAPPDDMHAEMDRAHVCVAAGGLPRVYKYPDAAEVRQEEGLGVENRIVVADDGTQPADGVHVDTFAEEPKTAPLFTDNADAAADASAAAPPESTPEFTAAPPSRFTAEPVPMPAPDQLLRYAEQMEWIAQQTQALEIQRQLAEGATACRVASEDPAAPLVATCIKAAQTHLKMELQRGAALQQEALARSEAAVATARLALMVADSAINDALHVLQDTWVRAARAIQRHAPELQQQCDVMGNTGLASLNRHRIQEASNACSVVLHVLQELDMHLRQGAERGAAAHFPPGVGVKILNSFLRVRTLLQEYVAVTDTLRGVMAGAGGAGTAASPLQSALNAMNTVADRATEVLLRHSKAEHNLQLALRAHEAALLSTQAIHGETEARALQITADAERQVQDILSQTDGESNNAGAHMGGRGSLHGGSRGGSVDLVARANRQCLLARTAFEVDRLRKMCVTCMENSDGNGAEHR